MILLIIFLWACFNSHPFIAIWLFINFILDAAHETKEV